MKRFICLFLAFVLPVCYPNIATANGCYQSFKGKVAYVTDGDTITVKTATNPKLSIRLAEIDAPETSHYGSEAQPYGNESRALLSKLVLNKVVTLTPHAIDTYGRTLATVEYKATNVNKYMVSNGAAWAYDFFVIDHDIIDLSIEAKVARLGLWADVNPIEPSKWRAEH